MYSAPLGKVIKDPNVKKKAYADDNYLYVAFSIQVIDDEISSTQLLERCFLDVKCWLKHNMLKLNDDKTKLIVFTTKKFHRSFTHFWNRNYHISSTCQHSWGFI